MEKQGRIAPQAELDMQAELAKLKREVPVQNLKPTSDFSAANFANVDDAPAADDLKAMAERMRRDAPWKTEEEIQALLAAVVKETKKLNPRRKA